MKIIYILPFFLVTLLSCKTKDSIVIRPDVSDELIPGGCYFSVITDEDEDTKKEAPFIIEIVPPKYEITYVEYSDINLARHEVEEGKYQFETSYPHLKFIINNKWKLSDFTFIENPSGYMYCMVEVPQSYLYISEEQLAKRNYKVPIRRLVSHSMVIKTYVKRKPKNLKENQYFFEANYWTKIKRAGD